MLGLPRNASHHLIQWICWNPFGRHLLKGWLWLRRRVDYVALNYSLHTATNGELWLIKQLPQNCLVLDVGYNAGDYTKAVLQARPGARVIAFDPMRFALRCYQQLHASDSRVKFESVALSNESGEAEFHDYSNMCSSLAVRLGQDAHDATSYRVPVLRLTDFAQSRGIAHIDFLKIDAEGYDLQVLEGASEMLDLQAIDLFMFEYADGWISSRRYLQEAASYLGRKPYYLFRLFNGFLQPFSYSTADERFDLGCMFVGVSERRLGQWKVPLRNLLGLKSPIT